MGVHMKVHSLSPRVQCHHDTWAALIRFARDMVKRFSNTAEVKGITWSGVRFEDRIELVRRCKDDVHDAAWESPLKDLHQPIVRSCPSTIGTMPIATG